MQSNIPQVGPKSVDPLTKTNSASESGKHMQNPADPTRKDGDVTPIYSENEKSSDQNPRNSGEISKVY